MIPKWQKKDIEDLLPTQFNRLDLQGSLGARLHLLSNMSATS